jgi:acid ceramidase
MYLDPKEYTVDVDCPKKWNVMIQENREVVNRAIGTLDSIITQIPMSGIALFAASTYDMFGYTLYSKELHEMSNILKVPVKKLIVLQLCYEAFSACTSVGFKKNDNVYHFMTMDWPMDFLKDLTVSVNFTKNGKLLFKAVTWIGCVGVFTGYVPGKYSVAINYRRSNGTIFGNIKKALMLKWPTAYLVRSCLEDEYSAKKIVECLKVTKLISPCYFTVVEAVGTTHKIVRDNDKCVEYKKNSFMVQANNDKASKDNILYSNERVKTVLDIMKTDFSNNIVEEFLQYPIINEETIYYTFIDHTNSRIVTKVIN